MASYNAHIGCVCSFALRMCDVFMMSVARRSCARRSTTVQTYNCVVSDPVSTVRSTVTSTVEGVSGGRERSGGSASCPHLRLLTIGNTWSVPNTPTPRPRRPSDSAQLTSEQPRPQPRSRGGFGPPTADRNGGQQIESLPSRESRLDELARRCRQFPIRYATPTPAGPPKYIRSETREPVARPNAQLSECFMYCRATANACIGDTGDYI